MGTVEFARLILPSVVSGEVLRAGIIKKSECRLGPFGRRKVVRSLARASGVADEGKALLSSSRWLYRGNSLISQTVLQPVPIPKEEGPWRKGLLDLIGDILSGVDVQTVLEPWVDGLSVVECNKIMVEVGNRDWSLAMDVFRYFKEKSPYIQKASLVKGVDSGDVDVKSVREHPGSGSAESPKASGLLRAYTTLVGVLSRKGRLTELNSLLQEIEQEEVETDLRFYNGVAEAFSNFGMVPNVTEVLCQMERSGLQPDHITYESMIAACLKARVPQVGEALQVFRSMLKSKLEVGVKTYLKLIDACVEAQELNAAQEVFAAMCLTTHQIYSKTWVKMIQLHASAGAYKKAEELFRAMRATGILPTASIYDALLLAYCRAGCLDQAYSVFREYKLATKPSLIAYNYLIDASGKRGRHEESLALYTELSNCGLRPSTVTYTSLISAMVQAGLYEKADRLYRKMLNKNLVPSAHTATAMINAYTCCGWTRLGHEIFMKLKDYNVEKNTTIYGATLKLYVHGKWYREAANIMKEMETVDVEPDMAGYGILIAALGESREELGPLGNTMEASDWEPCRVASFLVYFPSSKDKAGGEGDTCFEKVAPFFEEWARLKEREANRSLYNALMDALWRRGLRRRAQLVMQKARELLHWYNRPRIGAGGSSVLDLRGLSVGGAQVALLDWLEQVAKNPPSSEGGHPLVVHTGGGDIVVGRFGVGKGRGLGAVKQAVTAYLEELCSPFREVPEAGSGKLQADSELVIQWLSKHDNKDDALQLNDYK